MSMEDRMGMLTTLFEEESLPELLNWYQCSMLNHGMDRSPGIEKPAHIHAMSMIPKRTVSKAQVKKDLQQYNDKEWKEIMLLVMKGAQTKPQLLGTKTKWRNNLIQDPGKLHINLLQVIAHKLRTPKWQQISQKHAPTPVMMGGILVLTSKPKENQEDTRKAAQINMASKPQSMPEERQRTTVARIHAISTKNPELGRRVALKYLELSQTIQEDLKDDDHPDHIHTAQTTAQGEHAHT